MLNPVTQPPISAHLLLVGGSGEAAAAFMEKQHFGREEWWWTSAPGPLRVFSLHAEATVAAQRNPSLDTQ